MPCWPCPGIMAQEFGEYVQRQLCRGRNSPGWPYRFETPKREMGSAPILTHSEWKAFLAGIKYGDFDDPFAGFGVFLVSMRLTFEPDQPRRATADASCTAYCDHTEDAICLGTHAGERLVLGALPTGLTPRTDGSASHPTLAEERCRRFQALTPQRVRPATFRAWGLFSPESTTTEGKRTPELSNSPTHRCGRHSPTHITSPGAKCKGTP